MTQGRQRIQVRITLDSDMGPLFHWAAAIPERARARELVGVLRVGFAIGSGSTVSFNAVPRRDQPQPPSSTPDAALAPAPSPFVAPPVAQSGMSMARVVLLMTGTLIIGAVGAAIFFMSR